MGVFFKILLLLNLWPFLLNAWHDETHLAIAKAAGYDKYYNAAAADVAKLKAGDKEGLNHYFDNPKGLVIDVALVKSQIGLYNGTKDQDGHLYGSILASLHDYIAASQQKRYAEYHLAYCFHYIGDLSNPLHNSVYDEFNKTHHQDFDGAVETKALASLQEITNRMIKMVLRPEYLEDDVAREIAMIANKSIALSKKTRLENRNMTEAEAWEQVALSASLCKAILFVLNDMGLR